MKEATPVETAHLFPGLHRHLVELLRSLPPEMWRRPTVAGDWRVHDVVAHLLDVQVRRLSMQRDHHFAPAGDRDLSDYAELVAFLNELNASWVAALGRASPDLLVDLLEVVGPQFAELMETLDPDGPAMFPVAWAGETESKNWFDVGRDYTELWHHQAQIRLAVEAELLESGRWLHPVLALAVHGLRRSLATLDRPEGTTLALSITGGAGGDWFLVRSSAGWVVHEGPAATPAATVTLPDRIAWRSFFNALSVEDVRNAAKCSGDQELVRAVLTARSVMV